jgi:hypothetical protein
LNFINRRFSLRCVIFSRVMVCIRVSKFDCVNVRNFIVLKQYFNIFF